MHLQKLGRHDKIIMPRGRKPRLPVSSKGFTLMELVIATLIISFLGTVIYTVFVQGLRLWNRAVKERPEIGIGLCFEKLTVDLRNALVYSNVGLVGGTDSMEFYTLGDSELYLPENKFERRTEPLLVQYSFQKSDSAVRRSQLNYYEILNQAKIPQKSARIADHIVRLKFSYFRSDPKAVVDWASQWQEKCLPEAVKINLDFKDQNKVKSMSKIISLPAGGCALLESPAA